MNPAEAQTKYKELKDKIKALEKPGLIGMAAGLERLKLQNSLSNFRSQCQNLWDINLLEPCPFCGSYKIEVQNEGFSYEWYWANCGECEAEGPAKETQDDAIAAWNHRVN